MLPVNAIFIGKSIDIMPLYQILQFYLAWKCIKITSERDRWSIIYNREGTYNVIYSRYKIGGNEIKSEQKCEKNYLF